MARKPPSAPQKKPVTREYSSRGVSVVIREAKDTVSLSMDGKPIDVQIIDGRFHCSLAGMHESFDSVDQVVDTLLANRGVFWSLHGEVCCPQHGSGHGHGGGHQHDHGAGPGHAHGSHGHGNKGSGEGGK